MHRPTQVLWSYRVAGVLSLMEPVNPNPSSTTTRGPGTLDHLAMDASGLIGGAMRMMRP